MLHMNLTLITITAIYSHFTLFTLIPLDRTHDCNATSNNKTTFRYELYILIEPQTHIIILIQLSTIQIIDNITTLYQLSGHYWVILGSLYSQYSVIIRSLQGHYRVNIGSLQGHYRLILGSFQDHYRVIIGLFIGTYFDLF